MIIHNQAISNNATEGYSKYKKDRQVWSKYLDLDTSLAFYQEGSIMVESDEILIAFRLIGSQEAQNTMYHH